MTETVTTPEAVKAAPKPRAPKLLAIVNGVELLLLKYAFPVKAPRFPVQFNGVEVQAANTGGKGKEYTYFLVNNTSFYVPGAFAPDSVVTATFPEGYVFDEAEVARVSTYKPKDKKEAPPADPATQVHPDDVRPTDEPTPEVASAAEASAGKSKRRGK